MACCSYTHRAWQCPQLTLPLALQMKSLLCITICAGIALATDDATFDDCGSAAFQLSSAGTEPNVVKKSMEFNITWTGNLVKPVSGGTVHQRMWEKVLGHWIAAPHTFDHDICELNACPLPAGNQTLKIQTNMPSIVPNGDYKVQVAFDDSNNNNISCADVYYTV